MLLQLGVQHLQNPPANGLGSRDKSTILHIWPLGFLPLYFICTRGKQEYLTSVGQCGRVGEHSAAVGKCVCAAGFAETHTHEDPSPHGPTQQALSYSTFRLTELMLPKVSGFFFLRLSDESLDLFTSPFQVKQPASAPVS